MIIEIFESFYIAVIVPPCKEVLLLIDTVPNICIAFLSLDPVEVRDVTYFPTCGELLGAPTVHTQNIITQKKLSESIQTQSIPDILFEDS